MDEVINKEAWDEMKKKLMIIIKNKNKDPDAPKFDLEEKIHKMRVKNLVNNFVKKATLNSVERTPVDFDPFGDKIDTRGEFNGLEFNNVLLNVFYIISIINTLVMLGVFTMSVVFEKTLESKEITGLQIWALIWLFVEIGVNMFRVSYGKGYNKLEKLKDIAEEYLKSKFALDLLCWVGLLIDIII